MTGPKDPRDRYRDPRPVALAWALALGLTATAVAILDRIGVLK